MIVVDPFQAYRAWLEWDQDHYGPTRGSFCSGMWQLAHVKAYIRPIVPRNTVAPVTIAFLLVVKGFSRVELVFPTLNSHSKHVQSLSQFKLQSGTSVWLLALPE